MSWVLVMNPRSPHLWLLRLPSVSIGIFSVILIHDGGDNDDYLLFNISLLDLDDHFEGCEALSL